MVQKVVASSRVKFCLQIGFQEPLKYTSTSPEYFVQPPRTRTGVSMNDKHHIEIKKDENNRLKLTEKVTNISRR